MRVPSRPGSRAKCSAIHAAVLLLIFSCANGEFGNGMEPSSTTGFLLGSNPFDLSGVPEIIVSGGTGQGPEGGRAEFQLHFSRNAAWGLTMNIASTSPLITFDGSSTTSVAFPFGDTATPRSVFADIGPDANFTDDDASLTVSSAAVSDASVGIRMLDTDVSFSATAAFSAVTTTDPRTTLLTDVDGDGKPDLVVADTRQVAYFYRNTSSVSFPSFAGFQSIIVDGGTSAFRSYPILVEDLDGDGRKDLVSANSRIGSTGSLRFLRNTGSPGTISFQLPGTAILSGSQMDDLDAGDLDGDGLPDLVVMSDFGDTRVHRNTSTAGSISFASALSFNVGFLSTPQAALGDVDGDGKADLAFADGSCFVTDRCVEVYLNFSVPGSLSFEPTIARFESESFGNSRDIALRDMDGDGKLDLVVLADGLRIYRNNSTPGNPSFRSSETWLNASMEDMTIADLNGNGLPDIVMTNASSGDTRAVAILRNASSPGTINMRPPLYLLSAVANESRIASGDVDGDGQTDFVYAVEGGTSLIHVHENITGN